jgi:hypothetical protein
VTAADQLRERAKQFGTSGICDPWRTELADARALLARIEKYAK